MGIGLKLNANYWQKQIQKHVHSSRKSQEQSSKMDVVNLELKYSDFSLDKL